MASGTRLASLKKLEDDRASKHKTRKLDKTNAKLSDKKLDVTEKKIIESPLRRSSRTERFESYSNINSKKNASSIMSKKRKDDGNTGPSSNLRKSKKRNVDDKGVSSSTDDSIVSATSPKKRRKVDVNDIYLGSNYTKNKDNDKKTVRKHLHARTYKELVKRQASKGGSQGVGNSCLEENSTLQVLISNLGATKSNEGKNNGNKKGDVYENDGKPIGEAVKPSDKEDIKKIEKLAPSFDIGSPRDNVNEDNGTISRSKNQKRISYDTLGQSSVKKTPGHNQCTENIDLIPSIIEEHGVGDLRLHYDGCPEANSNIDSRECKILSQTATDRIPKTCLVCKQPGQLMGCFGKGCQHSYHLSCLEPLLPGAWLCTFCVKKKVESGVYSVSEGIESVWDIDEGAQNGKHYFVKYKGFSHAHNRWIPESQLLHEAPSLLAKFQKKNQKEKIIKWRKKWAEPERLLRKRLVVFAEDSDEHTSQSICKTSDCCIEWFVKWKGLHYDQATWELENSPLLCSSEAAKLMEDYEHRRELGRRSCDPQRVEKAQQVKKEPFYKLFELPDGCPSEHGHDLLGSLNCLREFWHRSVNAVLVEDQGCFAKSIIFVLSLQSHACRPSLIMTTSSSIPLWQAEFVRLAPTLNVVKYQGDKDVRKIIKNLEFYEESGCLMFQVLLTDYDAILEDFVDIACIDWEAVIIDKCEKSTISRYLEQLKSLNTCFKLLLFNGQLKDNLSEYHVLLSLVSKEGTTDEGLAGMKADTNDAAGALAIVKEKLAHHIAYECKADSSTFMEYWVPVPFSNVQLEQYCATFISNSSVLRSNLKSDVVGALHNIIITARKCCDHPYLVDGELRGLLTKGLQVVDFLNAEVRASGKLFLLDKILQEMKNRELRVVILFQSLGGPGKISLGDILDDFLQQRFGVDSYERIESGLVRTKKLASLNMFNNKESGRFVFLIEKRACVPSVKLRFVDAIILFDSDWNPVNDLRSLQKISIESQDNCIKVFRLYTSFTVEEKLLMFSKQDILLDSHIENINRSTSHSLLGWGASHLFQKLDQFHSITQETCISEPSFDKLCLNDVISEILREVPGKPEATQTLPHTILIKAQQCGATYSGNIVLLGEKEGLPSYDKDTAFFWPGLLEGRYPRWIHISDRSQRIRRKVHNVDGFVKRNDVYSEVKKKQRKSSILLPAPSPESSEKKKGSSEDANKSSYVDVEGGEPKLEEQRNLLMLLRPELSKLCDILGLPASVGSKAQEFLFYIMSNLDVCSKQVTVLQALKISLCWRAASMSRHRLDRAESLVLARKHLKFECTEEEAYSVYSRLRILKEKFPFQAAELDTSIVHNSLDNQPSLPRRTDSECEPLSGRVTETEASDTSDLAALVGVSNGRESSHELVSTQKGQIHGTPIKSNLSAVPLDDKLLKNQIDLIEEVSVRRSEDLAHKQQSEILLFEKEIQEERVQLEKTHGFDLEFIRSVHIDLAVINEKINLLSREFSSKMGRFYQHLKQQKEKLLSMQLDMRNREHMLKQSWLVKVKIGQLEETFDNIPLLETGFKLDKFKEADKYVDKYNNNRTVVLNSGHPSDEANAELVKAPAEESNGLEECCPVLEINFGGSTENITLSDEIWVSESVIIDNMRPFERITSTIEPSAVQEIFINENSRLIDSNSTNTQGADCSHEVAVTRTDSIVSLPPVELMPCHDATQLCFTTDHDQSSSSMPYCSSDPTEVLAQNTVMEPTNLQISENAIDLQTPQEFLSDRSSSENLIETGAHQGLNYAELIMEIEPNQQDFDNALHRSRSQEDPPSERVPSEHVTASVVPTDQENHLIPNSISMRWFPPQVFFTDPFQNELIRIRKQDDLCAKMHDDKKLRIQLEREIELEKVRRKYDALVQYAERECIRDKSMFQEIYDKVLWHKAFAEDIRCKYYDHKEGVSTPSQGPPTQNLSQQLQAAVSQAPFRAPAVSAAVPPSTVIMNLEPAAPPLATQRLRARIPSSSSMHSTGSFTQASPVMPNNAIRAPAARASLQLGRSPAPHLQRFRPSTAVPASYLSPIPSAPSSDLSSSSLPSPQVYIPQEVGADHMLESLLSRFPPSNNEFLTTNAFDLTPSDSTDVICLSDDD